MDVMKTFGAVLDATEKRLFEITVDEAAQIACLSSFNFQRFFSALCGISFAEYLRKRKLSAAAFMLRETDRTVLDIALQCGYDSPDSFGRAFKAQHGSTPSKFRAGEQRAVIYSPLTLQITVDGGNPMDYKIVKKEPFRAVGYVIKTTLEETEAKPIIPEKWAELTKSGWVDQMVNDFGEYEKTPYRSSLGICYDVDGDSYSYMIGVESGKEPPEGCEAVEIPAADWAVFPAVGRPEKVICEVHERIISEFLPTSGYRFRGDIDLEVYPDEDPTQPDHVTELWFPVVK